MFCGMDDTTRSSLNVVYTVLGFLPPELEELSQHFGWKINIFCIPIVQQVLLNFATTNRM
jgi:hypothetical protein